DAARRHVIEVRRPRVVERRLPAELRDRLVRHPVALKYDRFHLFSPGGPCAARPRVARAPLLRCPQTPSAELDRSRGRPPSLLPRGPCAARPRVARAPLLRCPQTPSAELDRSRGRPPSSLYVQHPHPAELRTSNAHDLPELED